MEADVGEAFFEIQGDVVVLGVGFIFDLLQGELSPAFAIASFAIEFHGDFAVDF